LITRHSQSHAILNHLGVPSVAMTGNPKNLAGEGIVVDVLVLEVRVRGVRMLRVEDLAEAFRVVRDPDEGALGYPTARLTLKTGSRPQLAQVHLVSLAEYSSVPTQSCELRVLLRASLAP
jgi:hypothetical protein